MNVRTELLPLEGTIRVDDKNKYLENHYASTGIASLTGIFNSWLCIIIFKPFYTIVLFVTYYQGRPSLFLGRGKMRGNLSKYFGDN